MKLRVVIACGGTGGHLFPGIAVSDELKARGHDTLLLVSSKQIDAIALKGSEQKSRAVDSMGYPGLNLKIFKFLGSLWSSYRECGRIFDEYRPDVVLGMGGFTSAMPLVQGRRRKLPTFIHDSNGFPGRVTRLFANRVTRVLIGFEECARHLPPGRTLFTGTPVRHGLEVLPRPEAAAKFGLDPERRVILVMGGSQGARGINEAISKMLPLAADFKSDWQFVHLAGQNDVQFVELNYKREGFKAVVLPFCSEMAHAYSAADLIVARSGASSLNETAHYGIPSILIPYPHAADDHQRLNALIFEQIGAAKVFFENKLKPEQLLESFKELLTDPEARRVMSGASTTLAGTHAARRVAEEIEKCCRK
jgi:UDP-N-acetylglucosamine--N-acetylmuramyl-(pentapeptide) pyrophosphoryl-undecaprenol N-acetylglucosamine transferase